MGELVNSEDLAGFPGTPALTDAVIEAAGESIRDECGWHIAPVLTETMDVLTSGRVAVLDTLRVVDVSEVRDQSGEVLTGWRVDKRAGVIHGLPRCRRVEVDLTHGYESCPAALKPVVIERARAIHVGGRVAQESLGSRSVSYVPGGVDDPLARYKLPPRP